MTSRRLFPAALLATTLTIAACACATSVADAAGPSWLPTVTLSDTSQFAVNPLAAVAPDGTAVVVWKQGPEHAQYLYASARSADTGEWSTQQISADGEYVNETRIAVGGDGNTTVVWGNDGGAPFLKARTYMRASGWSPTIQTLNTSPSGMAIAAGIDGSVTVAYATYDGTNHAVRTISRSAGSDTFDGDPVDVTSSSTEPVYGPLLDFNAHGDGIAMWEVDLGGSDRGLRTARYDHRTPNVWSDSEPVGHSANGIQSASIALDDAGNAAAFWGTNDGKSAAYGAAMDRVTGAWEQPATKLSTGTNGAQAPDPSAIAADNHGNFVAVWQEWAMIDPDTPDQNTTHAQTSTFSVADQSWSPSDGFAGETLGGGPSIAADSSGNMLVVLAGISSDMAHFQYRSFYRPAGGGFGASATMVLADRAGPWSGIPDVTTDSTGNFFATFGQTDFGNFTQGEIGFAVADATGPSLGDLSFQTSGGVDEDFSFSVSPLDAWSALGATTWNFGDDTSSSGTSVSHRFASAGRYTVTATSTDALGNSSSESQTVTVTAPPTPPAPEIRKEQLKLPPVIPARLSGRKIEITTTVPSCSAKFVATAKFGTTKYQTKLKLSQTGSTCTATGTIVLRKTPGTRTKLRVAIGRVTKRGTSTIRTLTTKRG